MPKRKWNTNSFKEYCSKIHNNRYNYDLVEFKNLREKVKIVCPVHGVFEQIAELHIRGCGCKDCSCNKYNLKSFTKAAKEVHGENYDYSLIQEGDVKGWDSKLNIKCNQCGKIFPQSIGKHLYGRGCPDCKWTKISKANSYTLEEIIQKIHIKFPDYNTSLIKEYNGIFTKAELICPKHGKFNNRDFHQIIQGIGCSECIKENRLKITKEITLDLNTEYLGKNYREEYNKLISKARNSPTDGYFEVHHILPKSMFPKWKKRKSNLIKLSLDDHYRAHYLLYKIYDNTEMAKAFFLMLKITGYKYNPELYEEVRLKSNRRIPVYCLEEDKEYISISEAARHMQVDTTSLSKPLNDFTKRCRKMHWCRIIDKEEALSFWKSKRIIT